MPRHFVLIFAAVMFVLGLVFIIRTTGREGFVNTPNQCPDLLIQKDGRIMLHNTRKATVPGVNPIVFENLEDYSEFTQWQSANGIRCPLLVLQHEFDAQGNETYRVRPSVTEPQGGLPPMRIYGLEGQSAQRVLLTDAGHDDLSYNWNSYPAYDSQNQNIGQITPQDGMDTAAQNNPLYPSPNPMDPNWGGAEFSQSLVDKGAYAGNEVSIAVP